LLYNGGLDLVVASEIGDIERYDPCYAAGLEPERRKLKASATTPDCPNYFRILWGGQSCLQPAL
jgi:hypothetical protein